MFSFYIFDSSLHITKSLLSLKYFKTNKENVQREPCERYENLLQKKKRNSEKKDVKVVKILLKKKSKRQYYFKRKTNLSKNWKQKLIKYTKIYYWEHKKEVNSIFWKILGLFKKIHCIYLLGISGMMSSEDIFWFYFQLSLDCPFPITDVILQICGSMIKVAAHTISLTSQDFSQDNFPKWRYNVCKSLRLTFLILSLKSVIISKRDSVSWSHTHNFTITNTTLSKIFVNVFS